MCFYVCDVCVVSKSTHVSQINGRMADKVTRTMTMGYWTNQPFQCRHQQTMFSQRLTTIADKTIIIPVFSPCKQRRNLASQSQCDLVNFCVLHNPRLHSPGANVFAQRSCSRQHRSSSAYRPTSLCSLAILPAVKWEIDTKCYHHVDLVRIG